MEVFAGGARLLLARASAHGEVLNNVNGDLANLYRVEPSGGVIVLAQGMACRQFGESNVDAASRPV